MKPTLYVETTFVSYLTARPNRDVVIAGHQQVTHDWWETCRDRYDLYASELVVREASAGDPEAAQERLDVLATVALLSATPEALTLAETLVKEGAVPSQAAEDALHIAIAATHALDYLLTWNYKHLANATMRSRIEEVCRAAGYRAPIICTPEELLEE
jgi:hypothetical protein